MYEHSKILVYEENITDDKLDSFFLSDFLYNFNKRFFFNKEPLDYPTQKYLMDKFVKQGYDCEIKFDFIEDFNTDAIGGFNIELSEDDYTVVIFRADILSRPTYFIININPVGSLEYEVNVIDLKKRLFFKDKIIIEGKKDIFKQLIAHYKIKKTEIIKQGFGSSAVFDVFNLIIDSSEYELI